MPPAQADELSADLGLIRKAVRSGVVPGRASAANQHWQLWLAFAEGLGIDPDLTNFRDPVPVLQVFAARYRDGRIAPGHKPVRSRTVEDALRSIGQMFASVGTRDIRKDAVGAIDFRLQRQLRAYGKEDPPPGRVKPIPVAILHHALQRAALQPNNQAMAAIVDMTVIAYFFLLRPGEYAGTVANIHATPFTLRDVQLFTGSHRIDILHGNPNEILAATSASLTFTTQKSGVRGEVVCHGRSGSPTCCPTIAIARRIRHLRDHNAPAHTPLGTYYAPTAPGLPPTPHPVTSNDVTELLKTSTTAIGPGLGFLEKDISARSLRAGGAMALLCARVDPNMIQLLGRWQSNIMLRYLHLQAKPVMNQFARRMLQGGDYALQPGQDVPAP